MSGAAGKRSILNIWPAILLIYVELMILTAVALLFSSFSSPALSALLTFFVFIIGHFSADLKTFAASMGTTERALSLRRALLPAAEPLELQLHHSRRARADAARLRCSSRRSLTPSSTSLSCWPPRRSSSTAATSNDRREEQQQRTKRAPRAGGRPFMLSLVIVLGLGCVAAA